MPRLQRVTTPDGRRIYCAHRDEVRGVIGQIEGYFAGGIQIKPGDIVCDVGANIGLFALEAARRGASVHAFEPMPTTFVALCANARALEAGRIRAHNLALGAAAGRADFAYYRWLSALSTRDPSWVETNAASGVLAALDDATLSPRWGWFRRAPQPMRRALASLAVKLLLKPRKVSCRVETFSGVARALEIGRIDLLKIDVEGAEWDVLCGIGAQTWPHIGQVVAEVHDENGRLKRVEDLLRAQGFKVWGRPEAQAAKWGVHLVWARRDEAS